MTVESGRLVGGLAACSRALDRGVTRALTSTDDERRRAAVAGLVVFVLAHLRSAVVHRRSTLVDLDRELRPRPA